MEHVRKKESILYFTVSNFNIVLLSLKYYTLTQIGCNFVVKNCYNIKKVNGIYKVIFNPK